MNQAAGAPQEKHSQLVNIFARSNIVLGVMGVFVLLVLMLLFKNGGAADELLATLQSPELQLQIPKSAADSMRHIEGYLAASLALNVVQLVASYALLKRRNWARLFWVAVMVVTVIWCIAGLFSPMDVSKYLPADLNQAPPETQAELKAMLASAKIYGYALSLAFAALFSWLAWRFCSQDIRREFQAK
jgi:flagellar basal body-associated protein FliL